MTTTLTARETALLALCMAGLHERAAAIEQCRLSMGRPLITAPDERARVALVLAEQGFDGIGRVQLASADLDEARRADKSLPDVVAGR